MQHARDNDDAKLPLFDDKLIVFPSRRCSRDDPDELDPARRHPDEWAVSLVGFVGSKLADYRITPEIPRFAATK